MLTPRHGTRDNLFAPDSRVTLTSSHPCVFSAQPNNQVIVVGVTVQRSIFTAAPDRYINFANTFDNTYPDTISEVTIISQYSNLSCSLYRAKPAAALQRLVKSAMAWLESSIPQDTSVRSVTHHGRVTLEGNKLHLQVQITHQGFPFYPFFFVPLTFLN